VENDEFKIKFSDDEKIFLKNTFDHFLNLKKDNVLTSYQMLYLTEILTDYDIYPIDIQQYMGSERVLNLLTDIKRMRFKNAYKALGDIYYREKLINIEDLVKFNQYLKLSRKYYRATANRGDIDSFINKCSYTSNGVLKLNSIYWFHRLAINSPRVEIDLPIYKHSVKLVDDYNDDKLEYQLSPNNDRLEYLYSLEFEQGSKKASYHIAILKNDFVQQHNFLKTREHKEQYFYDIAKMYESGFEGTIEQDYDKAAFFYYQAWINNVDKSFDNSVNTSTLQKDRSADLERLILLGSLKAAEYQELIKSTSD